ncbi:STAS domain-containing protein [Candidatus Woesearchaeota archaeon]|nr:STAS domain-containing protein [Candidatus Woesearchaeota archaeon]
MLKNTYHEYKEDIAVIYIGKDLMEKLAACAEEVAEKNGVKAAVLDFKDVGLISSSPIGQVLLAYDYLYQKGIDIYLCNTRNEREQPFRVLELIGLPSFPGVNVRETLEETLKELSAKN